MQYEYFVLTQGVSVWNSIESFGTTMQDMLNSDAVTERIASGWERCGR